MRTNVSSKLIWCADDNTMISCQAFVTLSQDMYSLLVADVNTCTSPQLQPRSTHPPFNISVASATCDKVTQRERG